MFGFGILFYVFIFLVSADDTSEGGEASGGVEAKRRSSHVVSWIKIENRQRHDLSPSGELRC